MIPRITGTQVMTGHMRLTTTDFGTIAMVSMGAPTNAVQTVDLPDGSKRSTGRLVSADISCVVMMSDEVSVAKLRAWFKLSANGATRYLQFDSTMQYYNEDQLPGPALSVEQCFIHSVQWPETNMESPTAGRVTFTLSIFNADQ